MKNKKNVIESFKQKVKELKKHNELYFNQDKPIISDAEYDDLKKQLFEVEKANKTLKKLNLLKSIIGAPPTNKFKKFNHLKPMLSLSNAFNKNDMIDFKKKINNFINIKDDNIKTIERFDILKEFFGINKIDYKVVQSIDGGILSKIVNLIYLLDYSTIYASIESKTDPSPVNSIDFIKSRL